DGYRDGIGEPAGSAAVLWRPAGGLQVPHGRPEAVERVADREPVAVPYDIGEGSGVAPVRAVPAPGHGQALGAAESPVQVAGPGLEGYRRQLGRGEPDVCPARFQLAENLGLDLVVDRLESAAGLRLLRDRGPRPVSDPGACPLEEVRQELSPHREAGQAEAARDPAAKSVVGREFGA